jgi:hypothetical protein
MCNMAARVLPLIALLISDPQTQAGHESSIALEHTVAASPFHAGDQLELDPTTAKKLEMKEITVLQTGSWPWVLVRSDGAKPFEAWVNFGKIRGVRRIAVSPPAGSK